MRLTYHYSAFNFNVLQSVYVQDEDDAFQEGEMNGDPKYSCNGDHKPEHNVDSQLVKSARSSPSSDDIVPKKTSFATTASYYTARGRSPSDQYYTGRDSSDRSSPSRDRVYDPTRNSYIPRDPDCPIHSPKAGSLRSSPARITPTKESPTRISPAFNRHSPTRVTPPRTPPKRSSMSRLSPSRVTPSPRSSPTISSAARVSSVRVGASRSISLEGAWAPMGPVHPSRASAPHSELLHCTICTQQFCNPKVTAPASYTYGACLKLLYSTAFCINKELLAANISVHALCQFYI